jgi:nitrogen fixation NifU-like protein
MTDPASLMDEHFNRPRNVGQLDETRPDVGTAVVTAEEGCGDVVKFQVQIEQGRIAAARYKTFGCSTAIAASSLASEWISGQPIDDVDQIRGEALAEALEAPAANLHCCRQVAETVRSAMADWRGKSAPSKDG